MGEMSQITGPNGATYETNDHPAIHGQLWAGFSGDLGFDIGAGMGQSLGAMVTAGRFSHVVSCEPSSQAFAVLWDEWGEHARVTALETAVADHEGEMELSLGPHSGNELRCVDLVDNHPDPHFKGELQRRTVPCTTLDALSGQYGMPDFVKIDTEGCDLLVLHGGGSLLGHAQWLVEWHSPALRDACREWLSGYHQEIVLYPHPGGYPHGGEEHQTGWLRATL